MSSQQNNEIKTFSLSQTIKNIVKDSAELNVTLGGDPTWTMKYKIKELESYVTEYDSFIRQISYLQQNNTDLNSLSDQSQYNEFNYFPFHEPSFQNIQDLYSSYRADPNQWIGRFNNIVTHINVRQ